MEIRTETDIEHYDLIKYFSLSLFGLYHHFQNMGRLVLEAGNEIKGYYRYERQDISATTIGIISKYGENK